MTRFVSLIMGAWRSDAHREPDVHFHATGGAPEVCHDERCSRPRLAVG